ncbi:DNA replication/repair protein RecF [Alkaliphilus peptidifermentans]|uniref:DNA replication and repair protein RecF n=1 Tax=Alkaliphilus peptidifermentans DSM 18978 TaxID=1120976 RepID=A0A1G5HH08_9FIRM|nr:DNA replication/repair protein RecF [Alkaliphilus peptidifermentans]SCY63017.1 DNA replication and repair protein RecF [Alkaliphilus peptidifermentans DSM 18978]
MYLKELKLLNYRNYDSLHIEVHPKLNIIVGENAQGKTNVIEAIYLCAIGKSFRTNKDQELVKLDKKQAYIKAILEKANGEIEIEMKLDKEEKKKIKVNRIPLIKMGELLGNLNVVIFSPDDLKIIKGGPVERRRFIDNEICQIYPKYYYHLNQYNRILQQRNKLLKDNRGKKIDLDIWNHQLANVGAFIIYNRRKFIKRIGILAKLMHRKITDEIESLEIIYDSSIPVVEKDENNDITEKFLSELKRTCDEEILKKATVVGPHRDDLLIKINNMEVKNYGSQGQQRTAVLSLKMAELEFIKGEVGEYPILLLDDVMSELDTNRQQYLINNLKNIQTFITTTIIEQLKTKEINNRIFYVKKGEIRIKD